jgi:hypothetical protein
VMGAKISKCRVARPQYIVKYFIASLSVRTRWTALVIGNAEVGGKRPETEFTERGSIRGH